MQYVGMMTQIRRNNLRSVLLLLSFPLIILATVWVFLAIIQSMGAPPADAYGNVAAEVDYDAVNRSFVAIAPWVVGIVGVWFLIAYFANTSMVRAATGARPLTRRENPRVYNIVENLCMTCNMDMPQINIVNDPQLNAFASGIDKKSYTVTVTTGLLRVLNDDELAGVLGHELTHIRNRDTPCAHHEHRLRGHRLDGDERSDAHDVQRHVLRLSQPQPRRERLGREHHHCDARGRGLLCRGLLLHPHHALCHLPQARVYGRCRWRRALRQSARTGFGTAQDIWRPRLQGVQRQDVAQLFIIHPQALTSGMMGFFDSLFSTHPDTRKRIAILEQF